MKCPKCGGDSFCAQITTITTSTHRIADGVIVKRPMKAEILEGIEAEFDNLLICQNCKAQYSIPGTDRGKLMSMDLSGVVITPDMEVVL